MEFASTTDVVEIPLMVPEIAMLYPFSRTAVPPKVSEMFIITSVVASSTKEVVPIPTSSPFSLTKRSS